MQLTLLLPALSHLGGATLSPLTARYLGRGVRLPGAVPGRQAQLRRYFDFPDNQWPLAALTRQDDCGDAADGVWLRADPCHIRPDMNGARLLAVGDTLVQDARAADALQPALQTLFAEAGFEFTTGAPGRWYLKLPDGTDLPDNLPPDDALGLDLIEHVSGNPAARRWRALLSEVEIDLHHHPHNAERIAAGQLPINSLWLWGGGSLPESVGTTVSAFYSHDETALALAAAAEVAGLLSAHFSPLRQDKTLFDLTHLRSLPALETHWLHPILNALKTGTITRLALDSEDGQQWHLTRAQRWRIWRKPWALPACP